MSIFGISTPEFLILFVLAAFLLGDRLPEYTLKARNFIRSARQMAEGAKTELKSQMGPEFEDVNWRQYDPRQYDPRKIIRDALSDDPADAPADPAAVGAAPVDPYAAQPSFEQHRYDPDRPTPFDIDAT